MVLLGAQKSIIQHAGMPKNKALLCIGLGVIPSAQIVCS
jgi:hypothetical protein